MLMLLVAGHAQAQTAAELAGTVTFNGAPVPGVTVTATRNDARVSTTTDAAGAYRLRGLDAGTWAVSTALAGFAPASIEVVVPPTGPVPALTLTLLPFNQATVRAAPASAAPASSATASAPGGVAPASARPAGSPEQPPAQRPAANAANAPAAPAAFPGDNADDAASAADGFLINGSVNNGAASPFAQARAFGNNRPGGRALYTGGFGLLSSHSALDARQYSFTGRSTPKPDLQRHPVRRQRRRTAAMPRRCATTRTCSCGYQHIEDHTTTSQSGLVPTAGRAPRRLLAVASIAFGRPVQLVDPLTGQPFAANLIPARRLSPQAPRS